MERAVGRLGVQLLDQARQVLDLELLREGAEPLRDEVLLAVLEPHAGARMEERAQLREVEGTEALAGTRRNHGEVLPENTTRARGWRRRLRRKELRRSRVCLPVEEE